MASSSALSTARNDPNFVRDPVWSEQLPSGFKHEVLLMYHGTLSRNVESILKNGFRPSSTGMLGPGVYTSKEIQKTYSYGDITFKLIVYMGRVKKVKVLNGPESKNWQARFDSAWVPNGLVPSGRQENCIKQAKYIKILGISRGFDLLPPHVQQMTRDCSQNASTGKITLAPHEIKILEKLLQERGIKKRTATEQIAHRARSTVDTVRRTMTNQPHSQTPIASQNPELGVSSSSGYRSGRSGTSRPRQGGNIKNSKWSVYKMRTPSGFTHRVFIMYAGTNERDLKSILAYGLKKIDLSSVLGEGIYVSRNMAEAQNQGPITLKLLVYNGMAKSIKEADDPQRTGWIHDHTSAWIRAADVNDVIPGNNYKNEINCIGLERYVRVLGVCSSPAPAGIPADKICSSPDTITGQDQKILDKMVVENGFKFVHLRHRTTGKVLEAIRATVGFTLLLAPAQRAKDGQLWNMAWNGCLENKLAKMVISAEGDGEVELEKGARGKSSQWWDLKEGGKIICGQSMCGLQVDQRSSKIGTVSVGNLVDDWEFVEI